jgi:hypothetical protein
MTKRLATRNRKACAGLNLDTVNRAVEYLQTSFSRQPPVILTFSLTLACYGDYVYPTTPTVAAPAVAATFAAPANVLFDSDPKIAEVNGPFANGTFGFYGYTPFTLPWTYGPPGQPVVFDYGDLEAKIDVPNGATVVFVDFTASPPLISYYGAAGQPNLGWWPTTPQPNAEKTLEATKLRCKEEMVAAYQKCQNARDLFIVLCGGGEMYACETAMGYQCDYPDYNKCR